MAIERVELTPDMASKLLSNPHPRQRRPARGTVTHYANEIRRGRWRPWVPDAILVDRLGRMFNGAHRCAAVVAAQTPIGVLIQYDADPDLFDVIDVGRKRSAYQFVTEGQATVRASASRVILWYRHRVDHEPNARTLGFFDLSEILSEAETHADAMTRAMPHASSIHAWTGIGVPIALATLVLAAERYEWDDLVPFVEGVRDPSGLEPTDPRRVLAEKTRQTRWRDRRRQPIDDWTVLVRALNAHLNQEPITAIPLSRFWPLIGESMIVYDRRRKAAVDRRSRTKGATSDAVEVAPKRRHRRAADG